MKRRLTTVGNTRESKKPKPRTICRKYNFDVPNELDHCEFNHVWCGNTCLELNQIKDISLCRPLYWGVYQNVELGGKLGLMRGETICSEYYDRLKKVEETNVDKGIAYHGSSYMIFFVNELYRRAYGRSKVQIRLTDSETGFPLPINEQSLVQKRWYEEVYPRLTQTQNWQEFWAVIMNNDFFARRVLATTYPDNIPYILENSFYPPRYH